MYLTTKQAAHYLGVSTQLLYETRSRNNKRYYNHGPRYIKLNNLVRYTRNDLDDWINNRRSGGRK
jgi:predicted DNA-binding transcriptional regulator AlpA